MTLIYPKEGIVTADYPLVLLNEQKRAAFSKLVTYLRGAEFQKLVMEKTYRPPINTEVTLSSDFPRNLIVDFPFPNDIATVNAILFSYLNEQRRPGALLLRPRREWLDGGGADRPVEGGRSGRSPGMIAL